MLSVVGEVNRIWYGFDNPEEFKSNCQYKKRREESKTREEFLNNAEDVEGLSYN